MVIAFTGFLGFIVGTCAGIWLHWWLTYDDKGPDE